jgi:four helix bundle protein
MEPIFDHEKLDVYGLQLVFVAWTDDFLIEASQSPVPHRRELLDQLERACLSILLNTAEGNGKRHGFQRAKFFDDARGSALECAACLDASVAKRIAKGDRIHSGKQLLLRIVAMLTRLVERFDKDEFRVRQDEPNA